MTETLADRASEWAYALEKNGRPGLAELLRLLVSENTTLATERNDALAAVTTAEQMAANAESALEAMTRERDGEQTLRFNAIAQRDALAAEVAALREAAQEFVRRVEAGEVRSKRSYAAFKAALTTGKERAHD